MNDPCKDDTLFSYVRNGTTLIDRQCRKLQKALLIIEKPNQTKESERELLKIVLIEKFVVEENVCQRSKSILTLPKTDVAK
jgi:hypothetical protein